MDEKVIVFIVLIPFNNAESFAYHKDTFPVDKSTKYR